MRPSTNRNRIFTQHDKQSPDKLNTSTTKRQPQILENKQRLHSYLEKMKNEQQMLYEKLSTSLLKNPTMNIRKLVDSKIQKTSVKQKLNEIEAQQFVMKLFTNPIKPIIKGYITFPLQNEFAYTTPESRQGCRVATLNGFGILLGGYSHKEHVDVNTLDLTSCQWKRKQEFFYTAVERLKIRLRKDIYLALGSNFSLSQQDRIIYTFGGVRNLGTRRTCNTLTKIIFSAEEVIWEQSQIKIPPRRNHTTNIIQNQLIIIGGIDDIGHRTQYLNDMYSINLSNLEINQIHPKFLNMHGKSTQIFNRGIAYHTTILVGKPQMKLIPDYTCILKTEDEVLVSDKEGLYIFGGKNQDDELYINVHLLSTSQYPSTCQEIETYGVPPPARRSCTLNYDENVSAIIMFGGTDDKECFGDLYMLFLKNYTWAQVKLSGYLNYQGRFDHCAIYEQDRLIIFGGLSQDGFLLLNPIMIQIKFKKVKQQEIVKT